MAPDLRHEFDWTDELNAPDGQVYQILLDIWHVLHWLADVCTEYPNNNVDGAVVDCKEQQG